MRLTTAITHPDALLDEVVLVATQLLFQTLSLLFVLSGGLLNPVHVDVRCGVAGIDAV